MKKKLFVLLVILAVVLTGVFAVGAESEAKVTLQGSIDGLFNHGPVKDGVIKSSLTFSNLFVTGEGKANGKVSFDYGYKTNDSEYLGAYFYMAVGDFKSDDNGSEVTFSSIKIDEEAVSGTLASENGYLLGTVTHTNGSLGTFDVELQVAMDGNGNDYKGDSIGARNVEDAEAGDYTATLTFTVVSGS